MHVHTTNVAVSSPSLYSGVNEFKCRSGDRLSSLICRGFSQFPQTDAGLLSQIKPLKIFSAFFPSPHVSVLFSGVCQKSRQQKAFISKPYVRFEVSAAAIVKITVFWRVVSRMLINCRRFGDTCGVFVTAGRYHDFVSHKTAVLPINQFFAYCRTGVWQCSLFRSLYLYYSAFSCADGLTRVSGW
jgi:hypothetical protein